MVTIKSEREIEAMAEAGALVAETLQLVRDSARPGVSTERLDQLAEDFIRSHDGATPSFKGLYDFPKSLCTSINDEVVHGIPSPERILKDGDIISVDCGVCIDGLHGDAAATIPVGEVGDEVRQLLDVTQECLRLGIEQAKDGGHVGDIGHAVQTAAEAAGYSVVRELVGHGIGTTFHEEPQVPNFGRRGRGMRLKQGMTIAIEPMINIGGREIRTLPDKWTVVTADGSLSAHFEHTVLIQQGVARILTAPNPVPATS
ncbi:MAG: type I methionyl aminopeptidase [Gemmatimonadales bacterium]